MKFHLAILAVLTGCAGGGTEKTEESPTVHAGSSDRPRLYDCIGENQGTKGNTRKDCFPNNADEAARDTLQGSEAGGR